MSITLPNNAKLLQKDDPVPPIYRTLYADWETASNDKKLPSFNVWDKAHCTPIGLAITGDDDPMAYFAPWDYILRNKAYFNDLFMKPEKWVNSNVKYDAHVTYQWLGIIPDCELICTVNLGKLIDSDRQAKGGYGQEALCDAWLGEDEYHKMGHLLTPYLSGNKDFGQVPLDVMAHYATGDVLSVRPLYQAELSMLATDQQELLQTEIEFTSILAKMERLGFPIDVNKIQQQEFISKIRMIKIQEDLHKLLGYVVNPSSSDDCFDVFCNRFGLPVLAWTNPDGEEGETNNPSFKRDVLEGYMLLPETPKDLVQKFIDYRHENTMNGLFWEPWQKLAVNGRIHSNYNQNVRSGRLSCSNPNSQQLNWEAKCCVEADEGYTIVSHDYSQIEYRIIVDVTKDPRGIEAYNNNPNIDYHQWVADLCGVKRNPAKTINFMIGFGGGKKKTVATLMANPDIIAECKNASEIERRALAVYATYHRNLPGLKRTSKKADLAARRRGYVFNKYHRRLHLPKERCHIAFNRVVQSNAADFMKERTVALHKKFPDIRQFASVHDDTATFVPHDQAAEMLDAYAECLQDDAGKRFSVPIRVSRKSSRENWGSCK